jgi:DNA-binding NarL/FixJ family response regulator
MIKLLIADDQTLMRDGLKTIFDLEDDIEVVGTAENGLTAYELTAELRPQVVLMDIRMPQMDGVESTKLIKKDFPETVVIILTTFDDDEYIVEALSYGANGYLLKDIPGDKLIDAVRDGAMGNLLMPSKIAAKLISKLSSISKEKEGKKAEHMLDLSERETGIASMLVKGRSNKEIAKALFITEGTVKNYISDIYRKIDINDRTQAVIFLSKFF